MINEETTFQDYVSALIENELKKKGLIWFRSFDMYLKIKKDILLTCSEKSKICNDILVSDISKQQEKIINLIKEKAYYKDELVEILGVENNILEEEILELEMKEVVFQRGGKFFL